MIQRLFSKYRLMEKSLDASWLRNETTAHNIANVDTPGYKRKVVRFEEYLDDSKSIALKRTRNAHLSGGHDEKIRLTTDHSRLSTRLDGNNVDIENEMALMAGNTIKYSTLVQTLNTRLRRLKSVINEGR